MLSSPACQGFRESCGHAPELGSFATDVFDGERLWAAVVVVMAGSGLVSSLADCRPPRPDADEVPHPATRVG